MKVSVSPVMLNCPGCNVADCEQRKSCCRQWPVQNSKTKPFNNLSKEVGSRNIQEHTTWRRHKENSVKSVLIRDYKHIMEDNTEKVKLSLSLSITVDLNIGLIHFGCKGRDHMVWTMISSTGSKIVARVSYTLLWQKSSHVELCRFRDSLIPLLILRDLHTDHYR